MSWILVVIGALLGGLLGGGGPSTSDPRDPAPAPTPDHSLVLTWSQSDADLAVLEGIVGPGTLVVDSQADRDALLARVPGELSVDGLGAVDLTTHVLVAGGYHRCQEHSAVVETDGTWAFVVHDGEPRISCGWSPYTIDVWSVPR